MNSCYFSAMTDTSLSQLEARQRGEHIMTPSSRIGKLVEHTYMIDPLPNYLYLHNSVVGVMKIGNIVPRVEIEPTPLTFQASVLRVTHVCLPDVTIIHMPTHLNSSIAERSVQPTTLIPLEK